MIIQPTRRSFLTGLGFLAAAPAIVRASRLMPIYPVPAPHLDNPWLPPLVDDGPYSQRALIELIRRIKEYEAPRVDHFGRLIH